MTNLPNPIYYDGVPYCRSQCDLFCGSESDAKCRHGFVGDVGTCDAAEMIADLVEKSRRTCGTCDHCSPPPFDGVDDDPRCTTLDRRTELDSRCREWSAKR